MTIGKWRTEIEKLEKDLESEEVKACEILSDGSEADPFFLLQRWALQSTRGTNVKADFELIRDLKACLESILTNVTEGRIQEAKYKHG